MSCGVAQQLLHQERQQNCAAIEHKSYDRHNERANRIGAVTKDAKIDYRVFGFQFTNDETAKSDDCEHGQDDDKVRPEPIIFLPLVEHDLKRTHSDHQQTDPPVVDALRFFAQVVRIKNEGLSQKNCENTDRNVDVENPAPTIVIGKPS